MIIYCFSKAIHFMAKLMQKTLPYTRNLKYKHIKSLKLLSSKLKVYQERILQQKGFRSRSHCCFPATSWHFIMIKQIKRLIKIIRDFVNCRERYGWVSRILLGYYQYVFQILITDIFPVTVHSAYTDTIGTRYFISYLRRSLTGGVTRFLHFLLFIFYRKWEMLRHVFVIEIQTIK